MKRLLLLRHAKALDGRTPSDHERPLAPRGIWAAEAVADRCRPRLSKVDIALCSSAIRARETLRLFSRSLPPSCKTLLDSGLYLADSRELLSAVQVVDARCDVLLLVGHEPGLSDLARLLCGKEGHAKAKRRLAKGFKTGSIATIDLDVEYWKKVEPGTGRLKAVLRPKDLA